MTANPIQETRQESMLDVSATETLDSWLAGHPDAFVAAVTAAGAPTAIPEGISLGPQHQTDERSLLELVVPEDLKPVTDAFVAALTRGIGLTKIRMASDPSRPLLLQYVDLRSTHGVVMRLIASGDELGDGGALSPSGLVSRRPRLGVMTKSEIATVLAIDTALSLMLGWSETDMVGHQNLEFIHPDDHMRAIDNWMSRMNADNLATVQTVRLRYLCKDGSWLWLETSNESHLEADGTTVVIARLFDVSEEMAAVEALRHSEGFLRRLTDTVPVGLFHIAADGSVAFVNPVLHALIGDRPVSTRTDLTESLVVDDAALLDGAIDVVLAEGVDSDLDFLLPARDGRARSACRVNLRAITDGDAILGVLGCVVDVTELRSMADTDVLTGLHNRRSVMEGLTASLEADEGNVAAVYLDLDHFKPVNDRHGHRVGDLLLKAVADRLRDRVRPSDVVGRLGGDEFLVVCPGVSGPEAALAMARRVQSAFDDPFQLSGLSVAMTASVGVACGEPGLPADELAAAADGAMYDAKRTRGGPPVLHAARQLV